MSPVPPSAPRDDIQIGARLRAARHARGLTLKQVADAAGLTTGFISRLERDDATPSVASLVAVCEVVGLKIGTLFDPPATSVVRRGEGQPLQFGGESGEEHLLTPGTQQAVQLIHSLIHPGRTSGDDLYTLETEAEVCHVLRGSIEIRVGAVSETLRLGDTMTFSGQDPHTWRNASDSEPCEVLWVLAPAT